MAASMMAAKSVDNAWIGARFLNNDYRFVGSENPVPDDLRGYLDPSKLNGSVRVERKEGKLHSEDCGNTGLYCCQQGQLCGLFSGFD